MPDTKYAIVTGAASGLGRALSLELAKRGWVIALCDLNDEGSAETLELVRGAGGDGRVEHLDVTQPEEWEKLRDKLTADWPRLDLLVNNAGVGVGGEVGQLSLDDWKWIVDINLWGAIYGVHTMVDWLKANRGSHIVNIASMAAIVSAPSMAPYNVTKAGMLSFSETLFGELMPHGVGVTGVCPAFFPTNIINSGRFASDDQQKTAAKLMSSSKCTAEYVSQRILRAIDRKDLYVFVPRVATFFWRMKRLMPVRVLKMIARRNAEVAGAAVGQ
ncbi:MAG: SDR family NAD(P)-dependent oxidoreductase [Planctomycetota bacterium]|nr:MAG: SDR family NAD(P)-dependent oxidoreductase [Planctomycetota bacterium]